MKRPGKRVAGFATVTKAGLERRAKKVREAMALPLAEFVECVGGALGRSALTVNRVITKPEGNQRAGWRFVSQMRRDQHAYVKAAFLNKCPQSAKWSPPWVVTLTRLAPGTLDDDNAISAMKGVRDAVAKWFGVDDGPTGPITWRYGQRKRAVAGVEIVLDWSAPPTAVDVEALRARAELLEKALVAIVNDPHAHPAEIAGIARRALAEARGPGKA